jgi:hypothetical protein
MTDEKILKCVAVGRVVWLCGEEWATCRTPGQAARIAEDINTVYALERRVSPQSVQEWLEEYPPKDFGVTADRNCVTTPDGGPACPTCGLWQRPCGCVALAESMALTDEMVRGG